MLNRRGYSSFVMCRECGTVDTCPNCDISLTLHMDTKTMNCHYCGFSKVFLMSVPTVRAAAFATTGRGLRKPTMSWQNSSQACILEWMWIQPCRKGSHQALLDQFGQGEADILLGTQMIAKGLIFQM